MSRTPPFRNSVALFGGVAVMLLTVTGPARPQMSSRAKVNVGPVMVQAARTAKATAAPRSPTCSITGLLARFDWPLKRTARRILRGQPIKIVAVGSSSTAGAGASSRAATYPSRLAAELRRRFPGHQITVLNRGVGGEVAAQMITRFEKAVIAENPDLVLWQVGTNVLLRGQSLKPTSSVIRKGLAKLKKSGADVVLIDPQFAPKVIRKRDFERMVALIAAAAREGNVDLFHRFALMRRWREVDGMPFRAFLSKDELHMNDWSYRCVAMYLANAITEAVNRPTETAFFSSPY